MQVFVSVSEILKLTTSVIEQGRARQLTEIEMQEVQTKFSATVFILDDLTSPPCDVSSCYDLPSLANDFMIGHPEVFANPSVVFPEVHSSDEVREWLETRREFAHQSERDLKLTSYALFLEVRRICSGRRHAHMRDTM
jgi:hypothetical protein